MKADSGFIKQLSKNKSIWVYIGKDKKRKSKVFAKVDKKEFFDDNDYIYKIYTFYEYPRHVYIRKINKK